MQQSRADLLQPSVAQHAASLILDWLQRCMPTEQQSPRLHSAAQHVQQCLLQLLCGQGVLQTVEQQQDFLCTDGQRVGDWFWHL